MAPSTLKLPYDTIDDLIYFARTGDLDALKETISDLTTQHTCQPSTILEAAIDIDDAGEGSGCCLLHGPSANGHPETLTYLLTLLPTNSPLLSHPNRQANTPLHWAVLNLHLACVTALVNAGADVNAKNAVGQWVGFEAERIYEEESAEAEEETETAEAQAQGQTGTEKEAEETETEPKESEKQRTAREIVQFLLGSEGFREGGEEEGEVVAAAAGEKADVEMSG